MTALQEHLRPGACILLDDGRRRSERLTAFDWVRAWPDLDLDRIDTVKGTWQLVRRSGAPIAPWPVPRSPARRRVHPRPQGFGLGSVRG